jgi:hypothetical protein
MLRKAVMKELVAHEELVRARDAALAVVSDMPEGPLRTPTYQTILEQLVQRALSDDRRAHGFDQIARAPISTKATGTTSRILNLINESFFAQPRSLKEIREELAESGFHYRLEDLGTPLTRLVQRKRLRRSQFVVRGKKIWKYSNH